jgi:hypothetical protein
LEIEIEAAFNCGTFHQRNRFHAVDMLQINAELLDAANQCQISQMEEAGQSLDPAGADSCAKFASHVRNVEAMIVHMYQLTAFTAVRKPEPEQAAMLWKQMRDLCDKALASLQKWKDKYPRSGTAELYDLTLDYRQAADIRYAQNLKDSECPMTPQLAGLFPKQKSRS